MLFNILAILLTLSVVIGAQETVPPPAPPDDYITKTQTLTTTLTHTVTVSLLASVTMTPPLLNNTVPTGTYLTASKPSLGPAPTGNTKDDTRGGDFNVPSPPKSTATFVPDNSAGNLIGNKVLIGAAGILAAVVAW